MNASTSDTLERPANPSEAAAKVVFDPGDIAPLHGFVYHLMFRSYGLFFEIGGRQIIGRENVPMTGPLILAPNHASMFDPPLVGSSCPRLVTTMGKAELFGVKTAGLPILGFIIQRMGTFPVRRGSVDRRAMRRAAGVLKDGGCLAIFPEGTRTKDGEVAPLELGMAMLAHANKTPVLPVYLGGTHRSMSNLNHKIRLIRTKIVFGKPLYFEEEYARKGNRATLQAMSDRVRQEIIRLREEQGDGSALRARWPKRNA